MNHFLAVKVNVDLVVDASLGNGGLRIISVGRGFDSDNVD